jgi:uncharacterized protein (TIGR04222 family)
MTAFFTMRGPVFLLVYLVIGIAVIVLVTSAINRSEEQLVTRSTRLRDPYLIAYLRGDLQELARVVTVSLTVRGLLSMDTTGVQIVDPTEVDRAEVPIEQVVLRACRKRITPGAIAGDSAVRAVGRAYERELQGFGLLTDEATGRARLQAVMIGILVLAAIAIIKMVVALNTGHSNIFFLIIEAVLFCIVLGAKSTARLTQRGKDQLSELRGLFDSLKHRGDNLSTGDVPEATLLAAVFGVYALPGVDPAIRRKLFPPAATSGSSSGGGSSCGSSGCGGGGCGGGGCGGCGS